MKTPTSQQTNLSVKYNTCQYFYTFKSFACYESLWISRAVSRCRNIEYRTGLGLCYRVLREVSDQRLRKDVECSLCLCWFSPAKRIWQWVWWTAEIRNDQNQSGRFKDCRILWPLPSLCRFLFRPLSGWALSDDSYADPSCNFHGQITLPYRFYDFHVPNICNTSSYQFIQYAVTFTSRDSKLAESIKQETPRACRRFAWTAGLAGHKKGELNKVMAIWMWSFPVGSTFHPHGFCEATNWWHSETVKLLPTLKDTNSDEISRNHIARL